MRYKEFIEGIRMGAKDLRAPVAKQYTVGFEFEIAVDSDFVDDDSYEVSSEDDDVNDAFDDFMDRWYNGGSTFDFEEWFQDNYLSGRGYQKENLLQLIRDKGIEPRYGIASTEAQAEYQNQKERKRLERVKDSVGIETVNAINRLLDRFIKDPAEFSRDIKSVVDFVHLYYMIYKGDFSFSKEAIETKAKDIIEKKGYEGIETNLMLYYEHMKKYFTYNESNPEDYEDSEEIFFVDKDQTEIIELDDINDVEDFTKYFDVDVSDLEVYTQDQWADVESELMNQEFNDWYNSRSQGGSKSSKLSYVNAMVDDEFNTGASSVGSSKDSWAVIEDGTPGVDAEITTPAFPIDKGIAVMRKMLTLINDSGYVRTSSATGLHINIGTFTEDEADRIDWLKFLMIMNAERVLQRFDRVHNTYAPDKLPDIISSLKDNNIREYMDNIQSINSIVRSMSGKYSAVNLSKLRKFGIIELRAPGNKGYETQISYLEETIRRIVRALELASDPNKYKKQYLAMLYKRFGKVQEPSSNTALDNYFINTYGVGTLGINIHQKIVRAIKVAGSREGVGSDKIDPNKGYSLSAHRELVQELKYFINNTTTPLVFAKTILDALAKYDKDNTMRFSKMINFILKELGKI
jgi:hypothetical protein